MKGTLIINFHRKLSSLISILGLFGTSRVTEEQHKVKEGGDELFRRLNEQKIALNHISYVF